ncbi:MAG: HipA domain-containing protein [Accumulibacter sp.]|uniref:HipA domain-containing protein n=1 Tax=Accumulibacter sp. TaxID=2053492 RepID=UPI002FC3AD48
MATGLARGRPQLHRDRRRHPNLRPCPTQDVQQLWRQLVFNLLITNVDDHRQNHGFLHVARGTWPVAPGAGLRHQSVPGQGP